MSKFIALFALGALAFVFASSVSADDDVIVLTEANFDQEVGQDRGALVEFYAPWYICKSILINISLTY